MIIIFDKSDLRIDTGENVDKLKLSDFIYCHNIFMRANTILYRINKNNYKIIKSRNLTENSERFITGIPVN